MEFNLKNGKTLSVHDYADKYFPAIQELNKQEQWMNLFEKGKETRQAWGNSNIAFVVKDKENVVGYIRGLTDKHVSLYICELLIAKDYRGKGIGGGLLDYVHKLYPKTRMEMLATSASHTYYESHRFRPFYGFRKTYHE
ncbi:Acetyltransferase (GNAT) domain-containing protein [Thalassobacillus cyri]|uniref:Acetyltransferase (GNAT) domain-containing protein n=1 Tax=Thalassobacillus cyri TaxID=571932 RepID=A0A1H3ZP41_9BACI|nr:GNAT family N-acetyltransferase [Thalassobacillus cyri]SEA25002.1 Acetyltransferase (GNAT) domain-containing protein [Thalassobacillus cyri]